MLARTLLRNCVFTEAALALKAYVLVSDVGETVNTSSAYNIVQSRRDREIVLVYVETSSSPALPLQHTRQISPQNESISIIVW